MPSGLDTLILHPPGLPCRVTQSLRLLRPKSACPLRCPGGHSSVTPQSQSTVSDPAVHLCRIAQVLRLLQLHANQNPVLQPAGACTVRLP